MLFVAQGCTLLYFLSVLVTATMVLLLTTPISLPTIGHRGICHLLLASCLMQNILARRLQPAAAAAGACLLVVLAFAFVFASSPCCASILF
jgi:membrane-bound metal-dependent hydrolase YbcI (DUF457 family)